MMSKYKTPEEYDACYKCKHMNAALSGGRNSRTIWCDKWNHEFDEFSSCNSFEDREQSEVRTLKVVDAAKIRKHFENVVDVKLFTTAQIITIIDNFTEELPLGREPSEGKP